MVLDGKPLLILKIISALCLLYIAQFYLLFAAFFMMTVGVFSVTSLTFAPSAPLALLAGVCFVVISYRQFNQKRPRLLLFAVANGFIAHLLLIWLMPETASAYNSTDIYIQADPLAVPEYIEGMGTFKSIDMDLVWIGLLHLVLLIIPFIVNFRKIPPVDLAFD